MTLCDLLRKDLEVQRRSQSPPNGGMHGKRGPSVSWRETTLLPEACMHRHCTSTLISAAFDFVLCFCLLFVSDISELKNQHVMFPVRLSEWSEVVHVITTVLFQPSLSHLCLDCAAWLLPYFETVCESHSEYPILVHGWHNWLLIFLRSFFFVFSFLNGECESESD